VVEPAGPAFDPPPLRSLLFVPGQRERWIEPAVASGTDAVLFDLQDAVPDADKPAARRIVAAAVERLGAPVPSVPTAPSAPTAPSRPTAPTAPAVLVRIGAPGSDDQAVDLDAVVRPGLAGVVIPHVAGPEDVRAVADRLDALERERGLAPGTVVMPLVETARAARFAYEVAAASPRVAYMGGATTPDGDVARALGFRWTARGDESLMLRSWVLMNVRAAGAPFPVSGLWPVVDDLAGLRAFAEQTRDLGYDGMMAIHPSHVATINEVFSPSPAEIARWQGIVDALDAAAASGVGAVRHDGVMVDAAHARTARQGLALARRLRLT
jgi:citrate lyase subunit beta/citryl-CoA lyase